MAIYLLPIDACFGGHQILRSLTFHLWTFSPLDPKAAGGEEIGMTELAERWSLSLFVPLVIKTHILLIKMKWF